MEKSESKLKLLERIAELEKQQLWHVDADENPETYPLMPNDVDYLNKIYPQFVNVLLAYIIKVDSCLGYFKNQIFKIYLY